jgi:hypothetical protein
MTAVSLSLTRGQQGFKMSDFTVGALAPNAGDIELRFQVLDANGKNINDEDLIIALLAFRRILQQNGVTVALISQPSGPP